LVQKIDKSAKDIKICAELDEKKVPDGRYKEYTLVCPKHVDVTHDKSIDIGFDNNKGPNYYTTLMKDGKSIGPELNINYSSENECYVFRVFLPAGMQFGLVFGEDYNVKGSDFIIFDHHHLFPQDMYGLSDGVQARDFYYYPINTPPLPVTVQSQRTEGGEGSKEFIYFRREDTGEP